MKEYTFTLKQLRFVAAGYYGSYYKVCRKNYGIKLLDGGEQGFYKNIKSGRGYASKAAVKRSASWYDAKKILKTLKLARKKTTNVPAPMGMAIIKYYSGEHKSYRYQCGYVMTHIKGKTVDDSTMTYKDHDRLSDLRDEMEDLGIHIEDCHYGNIMKWGKKFIFVDPDSWRIGDHCVGNRDKSGDSYYG